MTTSPLIVSRGLAVLKPSITYWVRGEPDCRDDDLVVPMQARIRDPLWILARQWQLGEFQGADSGSPAYFELSERSGTLAQWQVGTAPASPIGPGPLEMQTQSEPFTPDLATAVELGQVFEALLQENGAVDTIRDFRIAYPISSQIDDSADAAEIHFRAVCAGRAIDGLALYSAARAAAPSLPTQPTVSPALQPNVRTALTSFIDWVARTLGDFGIQDPIAWQPPRLEYRFAVSGTAPDGSPLALLASPGADGILGWSTFDLQSQSTTAGQGLPSKKRSVIPAHVRFRGAPNARFWDFETTKTDIGGIVPDKTDLARLAIMDFVLVHGNDWFVIPVDLVPGTIHQVDQLLVHDVFGTLTSVQRADSEPSSAGLWSLFTTSLAANEDAVAGFFLFPPTGATAIQTSDPLEDVQFARDEMANMVWGLERTTENRVGEPWSGHERDMARNASVLQTKGVPVAVQYQIESRVPEYWIPFLPVSIDPARGLVALERSAILKGDGTTVEPVGRILRPTSIPANQPYQIPEEEVPRTGLRVQRINCRSRWSDGTTYLWQMRCTAPGPGEANSALAFDSSAPAQQSDKSSG